MYLLKRKRTRASRTIIRRFTFHYVSIKTTFAKWRGISCALFTFHYVSIKTRDAFSFAAYTLLFTFHYVSIKTNMNMCYTHAFRHLNSTMYLLKLCCVLKKFACNFYLHSTMYLLKLYCKTN